MKVEFAIPKIKEVINIPFKELFREYNIDDIIITKGKTGKLLEKIIGLPNGCSLTDFEDGELKTNKSRKDGTPIETMFITQISTKVDELLNLCAFESCWVRKKIDRIIYIPVVKVSSNPFDWYFKPFYDINLKLNKTLETELNNDFGIICNKMINDITQGDGFLHTSSGKYIQIRTKDGKPYNPIYSNKYSKLISNKNFAFYFKKEFMLEIQRSYIPIK